MTRSSSRNRCAPEYERCGNTGSLYQTVLASHQVGALVIIGGMQAIEFALTHGKPFKVFEGLPIEFQINWLFNASDIGVIIVFLFRGVVAMWKAEGAG
jgi:hypothetical protein